MGRRWIEVEVIRPTLDGDEVHARTVIGGKNIYPRQVDLVAAAPPAELARGLYVYVQGQITHTQSSNFPERVEVLVHGVGTGTVERSRLLAAPPAAVTDAPFTVGPVIALRGPDGEWYYDRITEFVDDGTIRLVVSEGRRKPSTLRILNSAEQGWT